MYFKLLLTFAPCSSCSSTASKGSNPALTKIKVSCSKCNCTDALMYTTYYGTSWKGGQNGKFLHSMNEHDFPVHITRYFPAFLPNSHG